MMTVLEHMKNLAQSLAPDQREQLADFLKQQNGKPSENPTSIQDNLSAEDWVESLKTWAHGERNLPDVPAEALRRGSIYQDSI